jgi:hypothetical protein
VGLASRLCHAEHRLTLPFQGVADRLTATVS